MSENLEIRSGSKFDRKPNPVNSMALGGGLALAIGLSDWLLLVCYKSGVFVYVPPSQQLIEMAGPILLLPLGHYLFRILSAIGRIILNPLEKAAGEDQ